MTLLLGLLLVVFLGLAVAAAAWGYSLPRSRALSRVHDIETYGLAGVRPVPESTAPEGQHSAVLAVSERVGDLFDAEFMRRYEAFVRGRLVSAALYRVSARTVIGLQMIGALLTALLLASGSMASSPTANIALTIFATAIVWAAPLIYVHGQAARRLDVIDRQVPDLIDMLVVTLEGGLGFGASMDTASTRMPAPVGDEIRLTMQEQRMGLGMAEALQNTLERVNSPNMSAFIRSVTQGQNLGVSMGVVMRNLAVDMRVRRRQAAEERAHKAPVKMLFPLIFLMFPALGIVILGPALFEISNTLGGAVK